jgi:stage V sporulation protein SpoVS
MPTDTHIIRVAAESDASDTAGHVAATVRAERTAVLRAIGAPAVHQAAKALAIAAGYLQRNGIHIGFLPMFEHTVIDGQELNGMRFRVIVLDGREEAARGSRSARRRCGPRVDGMARDGMCGERTGAEPRGYIAIPGRGRSTYALRTLRLR